jgi:hypothetical protein
MDAAISDIMRPDTVKTISANVTDILEARFDGRFDIRRFDHEGDTEFDLITYEDDDARPVFVILTGDGPNFEARRRAILSFSADHRPLCHRHPFGNRDDRSLETQEARQLLCLAI